VPLARRSLAFATAAGFACVLSCASPTLPLPPPETPAVLAGPDADHIALSAGCGAAEPTAIIIVQNINPMVAKDLSISGTVVNDCGAWDVPSVYAHTGDVLEVTQQAGVLLSEATTVVVRLQ